MTVLVVMTRKDPIPDIKICRTTISKTGKTDLTVKITFTDGF